MMNQKAAQMAAIERTGTRRTIGLIARIFAYALAGVIVAMLLLPATATTITDMEKYAGDGIEIWTTPRTNVQIRELCLIINYHSMNVTVTSTSSDNRTMNTYLVPPGSSAWQQLDFTFYNTTYLISASAGNVTLIQFSKFRPAPSIPVIIPRPNNSTYTITPPVDDTDVSPTIPDAIYTAEDWTRQQANQFKDNVVYILTLCIPIVIGAGLAGRFFRLWSWFPAPVDFGTVSLFSMIFLLLCYGAWELNMGTVAATLWCCIFGVVYVQVFLSIPIPGKTVATVNSKTHKISGPLMRTEVDRQNRLVWNKPTNTELYRRKFRGEAWVIELNDSLDNDWGKNPNTWEAELEGEHGWIKCRFVVAEEVTHDEVNRKTTIRLADASTANSMECAMSHEAHVNKNRYIETLARENNYLRNNMEALVIEKVRGLFKRIMDATYTAEGIAHYADYDRAPEPRQLPAATNEPTTEQLAQIAAERMRIAEEERKRKDGEKNADPA